MCCNEVHGLADEHVSKAEWPCSTGSTLLGQRHLTLLMIPEEIMFAGIFLRIFTPYTEKQEMKQEEVAACMTVCTQAHDRKQSLDFSGIDSLPCIWALRIR